MTVNANQVVVEGYVVEVGFSSSSVRTKYEFLTYSEAYRFSESILDKYEGSRDSSNVFVTIYPKEP